MSAEAMSPVEDEDGFTQLVDADVPQMDAVAAAANGTPWFFAKQAEQGLVPPEVVRELIGKSEAQGGGQVTMTGSPAAVADLMARIHGAPVRKAEASTASMNDRPDSDFAYIEPGGEKDESGKTTPRSLRHFPIYDAAHVRNALSRAPQSPFGDKAMPKIHAAAKKLGVEVSKADGGNDGDEMDPTVVLAEPEEEAPGDPDQPGSPAWEAVDAATARKWTALAVRLKNALGAMADRELMEAMVADGDDAESAWDLQDMQCAVDFVIGGLAAFAVGEQSESDLGAEAMDALFKSLGAFDPSALDTVECLAPIRKSGRVLSAANEAALRDAAAAVQRVLASLPAPATDETAAAVTKQQGETAMTETSVETAPQTAALAKAEGDGKPAQVAVYDRNGNLAGVCDPADITPIADAPAEDSPDAGQSPEVTVPGTQTVQSPPAGADDTDVMKASIEAGLAPLTEAMTAIAKQLAEQAGLADVVKGLEGRVEHLASMPDDRRSPLLNGGTGTPGAAPRTAATDDRVVALAKAVAEAKTDTEREAAKRDLFFAKTAARFPAPPVRR